MGVEDKAAKREAKRAAREAKIAERDAKLEERLARIREQEAERKAKHEAWKIEHQAKEEQRKADYAAKRAADKAVYEAQKAADRAKREDQREVSQARMAESRERAAESKEDMKQAWADLRDVVGGAGSAKFDKLSVSGGVLRHGLLKQWPAVECTATVESGAALQQRMTATRVVAGAVLAGPVGAIIGGMAKKKSGGEMFLVVEVPGDAIVLEVDRKRINDAHKFAAVLNASSE